MRHVAPGHLRQIRQMTGVDLRQTVKTQVQHLDVPQPLELVPLQLLQSVPVQVQGLQPAQRLKALDRQARNVSVAQVEPGELSGEVALGERVLRQRRHPVAVYFQNGQVSQVLKNRVGVSQAE